MRFDWSGTVNPGIALGDPRALEGLLDRSLAAPRFRTGLLAGFCAPGNRVPFPDEAKACLPYLARQIRAVRPEVICTLGGTALNHLLGVEDRITRARGRWREFGGVPVLPTYHPAFILRNAARETEVFEDFETLARRLSLR